MNANNSVAKPRGGNGMDGGPIDMEEPGAVDNRLSLNPNDPGWQSLLAKWKDGGEYDVKLTISQISPGEFEVKSVTSEDAEEAPEGDESATDGEGYDENPVVADMVRKKSLV